MNILLKLIHMLIHPIAKLRQYFYEAGLFNSYELPGFVISIGNITTGGTGKTPVVIAIAQMLQKRGHSPAILARGYRSGLKTNESIVLIGNQISCNYGQPDLASIHPDEPRLQAETLRTVPVIVGADRIKAARAYMDQHGKPSHWILDDGFQHLRIKRDLDVVLFDATDPLSMTLPFSARIRREALQSLKRADLIFLTRWKDHIVNNRFTSYIAKIEKPIIKIPFKVGSPSAIDHSEFLPHQSYGLATGIANPRRLKSQLEQSGYTLKCEVIKSDHEPFEEHELRSMSKFVHAIFTTGKDYWRQPDLFNSLNAQVYIIPLEAEVPAQEFLKYLS